MTSQQLVGLIADGGALAAFEPPHCGGGGWLTQEGVPGERTRKDRWVTTSVTS